jgi:hypothetical protein
MGAYVQTKPPKTEEAFQTAILNCHLAEAQLADEVYALTRQAAEIDRMTLQTFRHKAYAEMIGGVAGAFLSFAGALSAQKSIQQMSDAWKGLVQTVQKTTSIFLDSKQFQPQQKSAEVGQHKRRRQMEMEEQVRGQARKHEEQLYDMRAKKSNAFNSYRK